MKNFNNIYCNRVFADNDCFYCESKAECDLYYQYLDDLYQKGIYYGN